MASVGKRRKPKGTEEGEEEIDLFRERIREAAGMLQFINFIEFKDRVIFESLVFFSSGLISSEEKRHRTQKLFLFLSPLIPKSRKGIHFRKKS